MAMYTIYSALFAMPRSLRAQADYYHGLLGAGAAALERGPLYYYHGLLGVLHHLADVVGEITPGKWLLKKSNMPGQSASADHLVSRVARGV